MKNERNAMVWSDTPPSEPGWYYLMKKTDGQVFIRFRDAIGDWRTREHSDDAYVALYYKFGPKVPHFAEVPRLQQLAEVGRKALESWGMTLDEYFTKGTTPNAATDTNLDT